MVYLCVRGPPVCISICLRVRIGVRIVDEQHIGVRIVDEQHIGVRIVDEQHTRTVL